MWKCLQQAAKSAPSPAVEGEFNHGSAAGPGSRISHKHTDVIHDLAAEVSNLESGISDLINCYQEVVAQKGVLEKAAEDEPSALASQSAKASQEFEQQQEQLSEYQTKLESANQKVLVQSFAVWASGVGRGRKEGEEEKQNELMRWSLKADR